MLAMRSAIWPRRSDRPRYAATRDSNFSIMLLLLLLDFGGFYVVEVENGVRYVPRGCDAMRAIYQHLAMFGSDRVGPRVPTTQQHNTTIPQQHNSTTTTTAAAAHKPGGNLELLAAIKTNVTYWVAGPGDAARRIFKDNGHYWRAPEDTRHSKWEHQRPESNWNCNWDKMTRSSYIWALAACLIVSIYSIYSLWSGISFHSQYASLRFIIIIITIIE